MSSGNERRYIHGTEPKEQVRLSRLNEILNERSLRAMDIHLGDRILDVGSGLGQLTRCMARKTGARGVVIGVDESAAQIAEAKRQAKADGEESLVELRQGSALELPLAEEEWGSFDIAHTRFVLEHVNDPEKVVRGMMRAVRPGGRVILEDDDHDVLRLFPHVEGFETLWRAYIEMYRELGSDPYVGRRLVSLLRDAGAVSTRNDWKFFGGCHGARMFDELIDNFVGIVDGGRETLLSVTSLSEQDLEQGFRALKEWGRRPDAAMWYGTFWAEGTKGESAGDSAEQGQSTTTGRRSRSLDKLVAMRFLADSARDLNSSLELDNVYQKIAERVRQFLDYHLFCVMLWNEQTHLLEFNYSLCFGKHVPLEGGFPMGHGLSGSAAQDRRPIRVDNVLKDERYVRHRHPEVEIRSELTIPLIVRDRVLGVLDLESTEFGAFTEEHEQLMMALARHIAIAVDNAQLYGQVLNNERRMEAELTTARRIQKGLLPSPPAVAGVDIGVAYAPARALAGDFYDFLPLDAGRFAFAVGDVAGKSTPAALYGSLAVGIMRGQALRQIHEPRGMLLHMNKHLERLDIEGRFVAMVYGVMDAGAYELTLANAGFPFPFLLRRGQVSLIDLPGIPLGLMADSEYESSQVSLEPGDLVVFCSDGFGDSENEAGEPFGENRVGETIRSASAATAQELAEMLVRDTDSHAGSAADHTDDRTVVVFRLH